MLRWTSLIINYTYKQEAKGKIECEFKLDLKDFFNIFENFQEILIMVFLTSCSTLNLASCHSNKYCKIYKFFLIQCQIWPLAFLFFW